MVEGPQNCAGFCHSYYDREIFKSWLEAHSAEAASYLKLFKTYEAKMIVSLNLLKLITDNFKAEDISFR